MKIAIDCSDIKADGAGISKFLRGLIYGLSSHRDHQFFAVVRRESDFIDVFGKNSEYSEVLSADNIEILELRSQSRFLGGGFGWYRSLAKELKQLDVDYLISANISSAGLFFDRNCQIIHDLSAFNRPRTLTRLQTIKSQGLFRIAVWRAHKLFAVSQTTKEQLVLKFPQVNEVKVVTEGISPWATKHATGEQVNTAAKEYNLPEKYLLSIGTLQPRKNYVRMLEAFAGLPAEYDDYKYLIVGGKGWYYNDIYSKVAELGIEDKIRFLGYVPDEHMAAISERASALAFVSLEEGFGLPLVEAAAKGLPIVTSDIPVFAEMQLPQNVIMVDPESVLQIKQGMQKVLGMPKSIPSKEFFELYSWENTADQLIQGIMASDE